jgi:hypothetical protein
VCVYTQKPEKHTRANALTHATSKTQPHLQEDSVTTSTATATETETETETETQRARDQP